MNRKKILAASGVILVLIGAGFFLWNRGFIGGDPKLLRSIQDRQELVALFNKAIAGERKMAENPDDAAVYLDTGLQWKSVAELTTVNQRAFFERSLSTYEKGVERFGQKNILFYLNAGKLAERVDDVAKAERYYQKAIEISPADETGYLSLVDLYYYRLHKSEAEILSVFDKGLKVMMSPTSLIADRATYLRRIGDNAAALEDYRLLLENYPNNVGFKEIVRELEQKIQSGAK